MGRSRAFLVKSVLLNIADQLLACMQADRRVLSLAVPRQLTTPTN